MAMLSPVPVCLTSSLVPALWGFEALSRGAQHATFVDAELSAHALIRKNASLMGAGDAVTLYRRNATKLGSCRTDPFTLLFLDPPYGRDLGRVALSSAAEGGWLVPDALVVWEESAPQTAPPGFAFCEHRSYGGTHLTLLRKTEA